MSINENSTCSNNDNNNVVQYARPSMGLDDEYENHEIESTLGIAEQNKYDTNSDNYDFNAKCTSDGATNNNRSAGRRIVTSKTTFHHNCNDGVSHIVFDHRHQNDEGSAVGSTTIKKASQSSTGRQVAKQIPPWQYDVLLSHDMSIDKYHINHWGNYCFQKEFHRQLRKFHKDQNTTKSAAETTHGNNFGFVQLLITIRSIINRMQTMYGTRFFVHRGIHLHLPSASATCTCSNEKPNYNCYCWDEMKSTVVINYVTNLFLNMYYTTMYRANDDISDEDDSCSISIHTSTGESISSCRPNDDDVVEEYPTDSHRIGTNIEFDVNVFSTNSNTLTSCETNTEAEKIFIRDNVEPAYMIPNDTAETITNVDDKNYYSVDTTTTNNSGKNGIILQDKMGIETSTRARTEDNNRSSEYKFYYGDTTRVGAIDDATIMQDYVDAMIAMRRTGTCTSTSTSTGMGDTNSQDDMKTKSATTSNDNSYDNNDANEQAVALQILEEIQPAVIAGLVPTPSNVSKEETPVNTTKSHDSNHTDDDNDDAGKKDGFHNKSLFDIGVVDDQKSQDDTDPVEINAENDNIDDNQISTGAVKESDTQGYPIIESFNNNKGKQQNNSVSSEQGILQSQEETETRDSNTLHVSASSSNVAMSAPPQRPMTAYNIFFQLERQQILKEIKEGKDPTILLHLDSKTGVVSSCTENSITTDIQNYLKYLESERPSYKMDDIIDFLTQGKVKDYNDDDTKATPVDGPKRKHVKSHGKIGFQQLAKLVAKRWKFCCSKDERDIFHEYYKEEMIKYKKMSSEYVERQKENKRKEREEKKLQKELQKQKKKLAKKGEKYSDGDDYEKASASTSAETKIWSTEEQQHPNKSDSVKIAIEEIADTLFNTDRSTKVAEKRPRATVQPTNDNLMQKPPAKRYKPKNASKQQKAVLPSAQMNRNNNESNDQNPGATLTTASSPNIDNESTNTSNKADLVHSLIETINKQQDMMRLFFQNVKDQSK